MNQSYSPASLQTLSAKLGETLPRLEIDPKRYYDPTKFKYCGRNGNFSVSAAETAELKIRQGGNPPAFPTTDKEGEGFIVQRNITNPSRRIIAYVGGLSADGLRLIIDDCLDEKTGNLHRPARLELCDIIGYRRIEEVYRE